MRNEIISIEVDYVKPLTGINPTTGQPYPDEQQQKGNKLYKDGRVGNRFLIVKSIPTIDLSNFSVVGISKPHTETTFLEDDKQYGEYAKIIEKANATPDGFKTINNGGPAYVEVQDFYQKVPPFYWIVKKSDGTIERRKDADGNLSPIIDEVHVRSSIRDGKPVLNLLSEAIRTVKQYGKFVEAPEVDHRMVPDPV